MKPTHCMDCGETEGIIRRSVKYGKDLCDKCYQSYSRCCGVFEKPAYGEAVQDPGGNYICHICGRSYKKLMSHSYWFHGIPEDEYKETFGLYSTKGLCCPKTKEKLRKSVFENYDLVVAKNLLKNGVKTTYKIGALGRRLIREQLRRKLVTHFTKVALDNHAKCKK